MIITSCIMLKPRPNLVFGELKRILSPLFLSFLLNQKIEQANSKISRSISISLKNFILERVSYFLENTWFFFLFFFLVDIAVIYSWSKILCFVFFSFQQKQKESLYQSIDYLINLIKLKKYLKKKIVGIGRLLLFAKKKKNLQFIINK